MEINNITGKNQAEVNLIETKISKLNDLQTILQKSQPGDSKRKAEIEKAARGFESMFVNQMIKGLKEAMLNKKGSKGDNEGDGDESLGADSLLEYTDMMISDYISKVGNGIGIASKVYEQLTGGEKLNTITANSIMSAQINTLYKGNK